MGGKEIAPANATGESERALSPGGVVREREVPCPLWKLHDCPAGPGSMATESGAGTEPRTASSRGHAQDHLSRRPPPTCLAPSELAVLLPSTFLQRENLFLSAPSVPSRMNKPGQGESRVALFLVSKELPSPYILIHSASSLFPQGFQDFFFFVTYFREKRKKKFFFLLLPLYFPEMWTVWEPR